MINTIQELSLEIGCSTETIRGAMLACDNPQGHSDSQEACHKLVCTKLAETFGTAEAAFKSLRPKIRQRIYGF